jgi:hypothetical protein
MTAKSKRNARLPCGQDIADEIGRLTEGFELTYWMDDYTVDVAIELEEQCREFYKICVWDGGGDVAKQLVAECERISGVYQRLAQTVKEHIWREHLDKNGDRNIKPSPTTIAEAEAAKAA